MGVRGLWRLLLPIGRRISIETLEGRILAIDASIWLTQFLKAMRDPDTGSVRPAAHLIGFFRRLCKLRYHGIRPVLVFDGATPEIKKREIQQRRRRREQIFSRHEQNTVQRMAKRILAAELKKKKQQIIEKRNKAADGSGSTSASGAYAPGFQLTEEEREEMKQEENVQDSTNDTVKADAESGEKTHLTETETIELLAELNEEENKEEKHETGNNWDTIVIDETASHKENSDEEEYKPSHATDSTEPSLFDPDRIGTLSSHVMKDAIEDARRQQRMRSRREFMPVAAKPEDYSQCQLRNFLRSSRLNKEIQAMATQVAQNRENGAVEGERLASDSTRRIIFIKDTDEASARNDSRNEVLVSRRTGRMTTIQRKQSWSDSEENEWEDPDAEAGHSAAREETKVSGDDDSSSESGGGFLVNESAIQDHDTESNDQGGGFSVENTSDHLPKVSEGANQVEATLESRREQELNDEMIARAIHESEMEGTQDGIALDDEDTSSNAQQIIEASAGTVQSEETPQPRAVAETEQAQAMDDESESSDDDIDWEDGDNEGVGALVTAESQAQMGRASSSGSSRAKDDIDDEFQCSENSDSHSATDGNPEGGTESRALASKDNSLRLGIDDDEERATQHFLEVADSRNGNDENDFFHQQDVDETTAALEHAQATASNLTDWAGRAFRRAIAKHAEETGVHSKRVLDSSKKGQNHPSSDTAVCDKEGSEDATSQQNTFKRHVAIVNDQSITAEISENPTDLDYEPVIQEYSSTRNNPGEADAEYRNSVDLLQGQMESLQEEELKLNEDLNRQERDMDSVTDEMRQEIVSLVQLFGIPYVEAPAEAEAQCAMLEQLGLVDGIVTEDSDVFVFGGKKVYKNIFDDQKYVEAYLAQDAERDLALGRNEFVALAMLLGGDYTDGVKGVGIVNGMEVLQAFDVSVDIKLGLNKFKQWLDGFEPDEALQGPCKEKGTSSAEKVFRAKHKSARNRWTAPKSFPADNVINAYRNPVVDKSRQRFSWGVPDLQNLIVFCNRQIGWSKEETEQLIIPVLKKMESGSRQTRMESFFMKYEDDIKFARINSKRLRDVFRGIQSSRDDTEREQSTQVDLGSSREIRKKRKTN